MFGGVVALILHFEECVKDFYLLALKDKRVVLPIYHVPCAYILWKQINNPLPLVAPCDQSENNIDVIFSSQK